MAKYSVWQDDYWLLLLQMYLRKPVGVKPLYCREMVDLSMELHIPPQALRARMEQIARLETPRIERFWKTYSGNPKRLSRAVRLLREMKGFGAADEFYQGVEVMETFEKDFRPLPEAPELTPVMLIMLLNLYFQLTPSTMVAQTPEVQQMARLLRIPTELVVKVLDVYQACDPYLNRDEMVISPLLIPCQDIWQRYGNGEPTELADYADSLSDYFKN